MYNNNISHNVVSNNGWGIYLESSLNNTIQGNNLFDNPYCLRLLESSDNHMKGNNVSSSIFYGLYLESSSNNTVEGNQIMGNRWGISIYLSSHNNTVNSNYVFDNRNGISVYQSSNNTFTQNDLINNEYCFNLTLSWDNEAYHNNFINNANPPYDNEFNIWDNGYPSGGNFWSDYQGVDEFSGPNQDQPGNDGIGDANYTIDSDSVDNYPLMYPVGNCTFLYEGWNLISIPFVQSNTNLGEVLYPILGSFDAVQWYNASDRVDNWKHNHASKPSHLNDLSEIDHTMGFWIHIAEPGGVLFEYQGTQPTSNQTIQLYKGWNMVGYPSLSSKNRTIALNNLDFGIEVDAVWTHNAPTQMWEEVGESDSFFLGKGYWIHATMNCVWQVPL